MSGNEYKITEVKRILRPTGVDIVPVSCKLEELQTEDVDRLVRDKVTKAFEIIGRPLFVEHTGLYLEGLNGLPAGLTQVFWDRLEADRFVNLVAGLGDDTVMAKTVLGYCDGRSILTFEGSVQGKVPLVPRGPREFQWDCAFVPTGNHETFAEMGNRKDLISMRKVALDNFASFLKTSQGVQ